MKLQDQKKTALLSHLEQHLDRRVFDTWCRRLEFNDIGDNRVQIPAPNVFYRDWLERELRRPLEAAFQVLFGVTPTLLFEISDGPALPETPPVPAAIPTVPAPSPSAGEEVRQPSTLSLNPRYTFENFVVGPSNRMAFAAAMAVSEAPGRAYNPLFIHGGVGLGKTHLLQAVCHALLARNSHTRLFYLSCENFVNDYISAVRSGRLDPFRSKYRSADVLLVDDIHFLVGKEASQEEFFHTFNALHLAQKQLILSSDQSAKDFPTLNEHLL